jgi:UDP-glucuronate decarboxylase
MAAEDDITGPINLGNPIETSVAELAERIIALTGSRSPIARLPLPTDDPVQRCPDVAQAQAVLGWQPHTELQDGLARTIAYFDDLLSGRKPGLAPSARAALPAGAPLAADN